MIALELLLFGLLVVQTKADVTGTSPQSGSCLCANGDGINVRSSPCGEVTGQAGRGNCFKYQSEKSRCTLSGVSYEFFKLAYGSGSGWIAGTLLNQGSSSQCSGEDQGNKPQSGSCFCTNDDGINVRSSPCGGVIGQVGRGSCFKYQNSKSSCTLNGVNYEFVKLEYGSGSGWIAGTLLNQGSSSQCESEPAPGPGPGGCPSIVSRAQWGARPPKFTSSIKRPVPKVFIHHTESPSCYSQSDCASRIRGFQNYHMDTHGWSDIGYNFLVGEDGRVYEGCGWDRVGIHARSYNPVSIGISVIGSFDSRAPNSAALNAVKQLISCGVSKGKLSSSYTLHGHRDGVCTSCPGNALYNVIKGWPRFQGKLAGGC